MPPTARVSLKHPQALLRSPKVLGFATLLTFLCACEKSSHDLLVEARGNLASASYDQAIEEQSTADGRDPRSVRKQDANTLGDSILQIVAQLNKFCEEHLTGRLQ